MVKSMRQRFSLGSIFRACGQARLIWVGGLVAAAIGVFSAAAQAQQTPSQTTSDQLNQLFLFETTPNKSAAGEGYVSGQFSLLGFPHSFKQYRFEIQGQYSFTDQLAVGGLLPFLDNTFHGGSNNGFGDLTFYAQYKLDQFINPDVINLTAQLDMVLPSGSITKGLDTGRFGVRPEILAYKDFGQFGPGNIGAYGTLGFTITTHSDFRMGAAATYDWRRWIGVIEFDVRAGDKFGEPLVVFTPGVIYAGLNPWEFAIGVPLGANNASPDWGIAIKATYAFQK